MQITMNVTTSEQINSGYREVNCLENTRKVPEADLNLNEIIV